MRPIFFPKHILVLAFVTKVVGLLIAGCVTPLLLGQRAFAILYMFLFKFGVKCFCGLSGGSWISFGFFLAFADCNHHCVALPGPLLRRMISTCEYLSYTVKIDTCDEQ